MIITSRTPPPMMEGMETKMFVSPKDRLDFYRREIHNEANNLSARTNAYLTAQSFLVIAYASSMANTNPEWGPIFTLIIPPMLALFGVLSSMSAWPGIQAACDIIDHWHQKQTHLLNCQPETGPVYDDAPLFSSWESTYQGQSKALIFSKRTPWLFSAFWVFLGLFALIIQFL